MLVAAITFGFLFLLFYILVSNFINKKFFNEISYISLIEDEKVKITCQNPAPSQGKKTNRKNSSSDSKSKKESLSFSPQFFNPLHTSFFNSYHNIKLLYTFCAFFATSIAMILISTALLFVPYDIYRSLSLSFLAFGLISSLIFVIIGFYSSCFNGYETKTSEEYTNPTNPTQHDKIITKFLSFVAIPILSVFSQASISRFLPFGPFSIHILFNNNKNIVTYIAFAVSLLFSFSYISSTKLGNTLHKTFRNPPRTLYTTNYYKKTITHIFGLTATLFEILYNFVPTDVFFLFGIKFYLPEKVNDLKVDFVFSLLVFVSSIVRIVVTKNMLQLIILRDSLSAMYLLDVKRTITSWNNVEQTTNMLLSNLPLNAIAFFLPGFVNIVTFLVYFMSILVEITAKCTDELKIVPYLRILSIFVMSSNEISTAMQQFIPDNC